MRRSPGFTTQVAHNQFSDWTEAEFNQTMGYRGDLNKGSKTFAFPEANEDSVDWRERGAVTDVKNQKSCGSCWAFSTTGAIEGAYFNATKELVSFSEQQFVDCDKKNGDHGCFGGLMDNAFKYAMNVKIEKESDYPYKGRTFGGDCNYDAAKGVAQVVSYVDVETNNVDALKNALANGPVSVAIQANKPVFQMYKGGIITSEECGTNLDHGVLCVGYGEENGTGYFIVKNSWGPTWGEEGYVRLGQESTNPAGICGILSGPPSQPKC